MNRKKHAIRIMWFAISLLGMTATAVAQQDFKFDHLTQKQGLSQNTVLCILQDRQGFMWFGTQDGLNRYDGYDFTVFRHDPADPKSLTENFIVYLAEASIPSFRSCNVVLLGSAFISRAEGSATTTIGAYASTGTPALMRNDVT